jgi:hypothetical protein
MLQTTLNLRSRRGSLLKSRQADLPSRVGSLLHSGQTVQVRKESNDGEENSLLSKLLPGMFAR